MPHDDRDLLEVLRFELNFLEQGGYGRSVRTPWQPTSIFQDSLSCLNFNDPARPHPCDECLLYDLVPQEKRTEPVPCHHIPISERGETIATLDVGYNHESVEEQMIKWLRRTIARLEHERATSAGAA